MLSAIRELFDFNRFATQAYPRCLSVSLGIAKRSDPTGKFVAFAADEK